MLHDLLAKKWFQPLLIVIACVLLNINTFHHEYALDDEMVLNKNILVHKGFSGIPEILSEDAYRSYFTYMGADQLNLSGGRYRPLSIVSFAIEQQLFGKTVGRDFLDSKERLRLLETGGGTTADIRNEAENLKQLNEQLSRNALQIASIRHILQVFFYTISCLCLFWFLGLLFNHISLLPLVATLLFAFHPVHTEVVANVKSRDEIFSMIFILLCCSYFIQYFRNPGSKAKLFWGLVFYFLAFLSKEYAFALLGLIPALYYLTGKEPVFAFLQRGWFWTMFLCTLLFAFVRYVITKGPVAPTTDVLNDPYLYAAPAQKAATIIAVWLEYLRILVWPFRLSSDYSFSTFPYLEFSSPKTAVSFVIWTGIALSALFLFLKRNMLALPLLWFLAFFVLVNNLLFDIGATMGERLIFHSSAGFCILFAYLLLSPAVFKRGDKKNLLAPFLILVPVLMAFGYKTVERNVDWKNDYTLFTTDVKTVPNSAMANNNAGTQIFNRGHQLVGNKLTLTPEELKVFYPYIAQSLIYFDKAISVHEKFINARINRGLCYLYLDDLDKAMVDWRAVKVLYPSRNPHLVQHAETLLNRGLNYGAKKDFKNAIRMLSAAVVLDPANAVIWNNLGGAFYMNGQMQQAKEAFARAMEINPALQDAKNGYNAADYNLKSRR